jgi:LPXTG-motif cell wall-anchored protein
VDVEIEGASFTITTITNDQNGIEISRSTSTVVASVVSVDRVKVFLAGGGTRESTDYEHYGGVSGTAQNEFRAVNTNYTGIRPPALNLTTWGGQSFTAFELRNIDYIEAVVDFSAADGTLYNDVLVRIDNQELIDGVYRCPGKSVNGYAGIDLMMKGEGSSYEYTHVLEANPIITKEFRGEITPEEILESGFYIGIADITNPSDMLTLTLTGSAVQTLTVGGKTVTVSRGLSEDEKTYTWGIVGLPVASGGTEYTVTEYGYNTTDPLQAKYVDTTWTNTYDPKTSETTVTTYPETSGTTPYTSTIRAENDSSSRVDFVNNYAYTEALGDDEVDDADDDEVDEADRVDNVDKVDEAETKESAPISDDPVSNIFGSSAAPVEPVTNLGEAGTTIADTKTADTKIAGTKALGESGVPLASAPDVSETGDLPQTGDEATLVLWLVAGAASAIMLLILLTVVIRNKRKAY